MIRLFATVPLIALAGFATLPADAPLAAKSYAALEDIEWTYGPSESRHGPGNQLRFSRRDGVSNMGSSQAETLMGDAAIAALDTPGAPINFDIRGEPGTLSCKGSVAAPGNAAGTCRFDPDICFIAAFEEKGLAPDDSEDLFGATLVGVRLAQVEGLEKAGYRFDEFDDAIAVAALEVTPDFARELDAGGVHFGDLGDLVGAKAVGVTPGYVADLRKAGLRLDDPDEIVAARAVGVDPAWLEGMASVGFSDLPVDKAIQLKAMDVTPDYAAGMKRVLAAVGE